MSKMIANNYNDAMYVSGRINEFVDQVISTIVEMRKKDWHLVESTLRNYFRGANLFVESNSLSEFITSNSVRTTVIGELVYDLYTSQRARDIVWFKDAFTASLINH